MKPDTLNQFVKLRKALLTEKASHLERLAQIDKALGTALVAVPAAAAKAPAPAKAPATRAQQPVRRKKSGRIPGQPSLKEAVRQLIAVKPLTRGEILAALRKSGHKFAESSLEVALYKKGNFKRVEGKFSPAG